MFKFFKKPAYLKGCQHDWEVVKYYSWDTIAKHVCKLEGIEYTPYNSKISYISCSDTLELNGHVIIAPWRIDTNNKVCLKCGECNNGFGKAAKWLQKQYGLAEKRSIIGKQRAEKAKKLWKENCLYSDT